MEIIGDILPKTVKEVGFEKSYHAQSVLFYWEKIVGADLAEQSQPLSIHHGTLLLAVKNSVWCHHLSMMKAQLMKKINQFVKSVVVRDIRFRNQFWTKAVREENQEAEPNLAAQVRKVLLDENEISFVSALSAHVKDEELKTAVQRALCRHVASRKIKKKYHWHACAQCSALCPEEDQLCHACKLAGKHEHMRNIRQILLTVPWATYGQVHEQVSCTNREYIEAKVSLLRVIAEKIEDEKRDYIHIWTLTMLFTGAKYDELNETLIEKTMAKFRRKKYVSASGI